METKRPPLSLPDECYQDTPLIVLKRGEELVTLIDQGNVKISRSNSSKKRCVKTAIDQHNATR